MTENQEPTPGDGTEQPRPPAPGAYPPGPSAGPDPTFPPGPSAGTPQPPFPPGPSAGTPQPPFPPGPSAGGTPPPGPPPGGYAPPPPYGTPAGPGYGYQGPAASSDDRAWILLAHFGAVVLGFIAPLIVMLVKPDSPAVRAHAVEALNFQLTWFVALVIITIVTCGFGSILFLFPVIMAIIAGVKAANGEPFRYPMTLRLIK
jgi:uncharacterized Tic20 family protein